MAFCGSRGERPSQVIARAIDLITAGFKFEGAGNQSADGLADQGEAAHRLKAV